jgi:hypothetical protein
MKKFILAIAAAAALTFSASDAKAQFPYYGGYGSYPAVGFQRSNTFVNPYYGYRAFNNSGFYSTPYGTSFYQNYGAFQRPIYSGPFHSIYPSPSGYTYGSGYLNGGGFSTQRYYFGW